MKILKIESGKALFSIDGSTWQSIDSINKDGLMGLLRSVLTNDVSMDEYNESLIMNQSHQIIYKSIYDKLTALIPQKSKFKDESDRTYLSAIERYSE
jgi:hypothetical protein